MEKATELVGFMTQKDCSRVSDSTTDILEDKIFKEPKNGKKEIISKVIK